MHTDWKDVLAAVRPESTPQEDSAPPASDNGREEETPVRGQTLCLSFQRRAGKPATVITGWEGSPGQLDRLAAWLKVSLACGGSARGGEILLQGDVRAKARVLLAGKGYKVKGG